MDEFDILQIVGEGWFGKILLVEHRATDTEMVLKGIIKFNTLIKETINNIFFCYSQHYQNLMYLFKIFIVSFTWVCV